MEILEKGVNCVQKRIISLVLVAVVLLTTVAVGVSADQVLKTSAEAVKLLKAEEGFSKTPYWDYAQWTVGYGTKCPDDKLEEYKKNGISEEAAEALLVKFLARFESELYSFMNRTGVTLNQNQFDALMLFSYNCGTSWAYSTQGTFYNAIVSGATGNALIDAFSRWCNAGGQIKTFLLRRRLCEANIYLNGVYSQTPPENFGYILYDPCGGTVATNVQGYDANLKPKITLKPTYDGYTFQGWYTARVGGQQVKALTADVKNGRLYAHWEDSQGNDPAKDTSVGITVTVTEKEVNVRQGPSTDYKAIGKAYAGDVLTITETAEGLPYKWGKFYGGWLCLKYTTYDQAVKEEEKPETTTIRYGTVKVSDTLRIRSGPSTGYSVAGYLKNGDRVEILQEQIAGSMVWGKISKGWISLDYVVLDPVEEKEPEPTQPEEPTVEETQPETTPETTPAEPSKTLVGKVNVKDFLRVRSGPDISSAVVGYLSANETVTITETVDSGSMTWGKISKGWISMDYVVLETQEQVAPATKITGTVKVNDFLRVRSGPGTSYAIAGYLSANAKVEITEKKTVGETVWGKISKGWISLDYVKLDNSGATNPPAQEVTKTVTADCLRVRSDAGTSYAIVGYLYSGTKVTVLSTKTVNGTKWGKISTGWISMDYVK